MKNKRKLELSAKRIYLFTAAGLALYLFFLVGLILTSQKQLPVLKILLFGAIGGIFVVALILFTLLFIKKLLREDRGYPFLKK